MTSPAPPLGQRDPASFRDPSGYVFRRDGRIFRSVAGDSLRALERLDSEGVLAKLVDGGLLVRSRFVDEADLVSSLTEAHPGYRRFIEHDLLSPITYPYEWTVSMLADAAVHTIDLQTRLLEHGASLKDATAYNIQFVHDRPVFIDVSSIEEPARLDVWFALGQFNQMFLFPLLLLRYHGWDLRSYFLGSIGGREIEQVARAHGRFERWRPRNLLDVTLPLLFQRRANKGGGKGREILEKENKNAGPQLVNLRRLRRKVRKLAKDHRAGSTWSDYTETCSYDDEAREAKKRLVREYLEELRPATVLDVGCNTGNYSYIAAECGARVIAADADHDAVDILYGRLKKNPKAITPLVLDLANPSPAIGFMNVERPSLLDRLEVECVLGLALIHHLHVSGNLPLAAIRDLFSRMTRDHLVLEFVPTDDVQFKRLTRFRADLYGDFTLDVCRRVFDETFHVVRESPVPGSPRTLLFLRKRAR